MEQYFVTVSFLNENSIIFDRYEEYGALVSQYMEGLFALQACSKNLAGKLNYFSDNLIWPLVFYGEPEKKLDHTDRYQIAMAAFKSEEHEVTIYKLFGNLLEQYEGLSKKFDDKLNKATLIFLTLIFTDLLIA